MAGGVEDLGGIGIRVIADASQIRKGFEAELKGFTSNPIKIPVTIDDKGQIAELRRRLRDLSVPIKVTASRESARELKRTLQQRIEGEGGILLPVKVKSFSSGEAQTIRDQIKAAVGPLEFDVTVRIRTEGGPGGPGGAGPGGFWVRPGGGGPRAGGPVARPGVVVAPSARDAAASRDEAEAAATQGPVVGARQPRRPRQRPGRFSRLEGESETQHRARLREMQTAEETVVAEKGTDSRQGIRSYNRLISIRKQLGQEGPTARLPYPAEGQGQYPERIDAAGNIVRGGAPLNGPQIGPLRTDASSRRRSTAAGIASGQASLAEQFSERDILQRAFGIELDENGNVTNINERGGKQGLRARNIEAYTSTQSTGFRGQRATMGRFGEGLHLTPQEEEQRRVENATRIAMETTPTEAVSEQVKRLHPTRGAGGRFLAKGDREKLRGDRLAELLGPAFTEANAALEAGDLPTALRTAGKARGELLGRAFGGQIEGVGKATAKRVLDPKRSDLPPNATPAQADFVLQMDALGAIMQDVFRQWDERAAQERRSAGGVKAAETRRGETTGRAPTATRVSQVTGGVFEEKMGRAEAARSHEAWRKTMQYEPVVRDFGEATTGPTLEDIAGGDVPPPVAPGVVGGGGEGGEGFFVPFGGFGGGGGGGPFDVIVQNWPEWMTSQSAQAAGPMKGLTPGEQEQALRGTAGTISAEDMAAAAAGVEVGTTRGKRQKRAKTAEDKEAEELFGGRARSFGAVINTIQATPGERVNEQQIAAARETAASAREEREKSLREAQEVATTAVQESPSRAVAVAAGQFVQARFGGRSGILTRKQEADRETAKTLQTSKKLEDAEAALALMIERRAKITDTSTKAYRQQTAQIEVQQTAINDLTDLYDKQEKVAERANKRVATGADVAKSFGAGVLGTIAGQILFQTVLGGVQKGIELFNASAGQAIERNTGYANATRELTGALSEQIKASEGNAQKTTASAFAQARFSDDTYKAVGGLIEQRAAGEAANKTLEQQQQILGASRNIARQNAGVGGGYDASLFETTGGFNVMGIQTPIGGVKSAQELAAFQLDTIPNREARSRIPANDVAEGSPVRLNPFRADSVFNPINPFDASLEDQVAAVQDATEGLERFNEQVEKGALSAGRLVTATDEQALAAEKLFDQAGLNQIGDQLREQGLAVQGVTTPQQAVDFAASYQRGATRPSQGALMAASEDQLRAQQFLVRQNLKDTLETFLPAQRGIQFNAQPVPPFARGLVPSGGDEGVTGLNIGGQAQFGGVPPAATASFDQYRDRAQAAIDAINAKAAEGERVLMEKLGVPESTIAQLRSYGDQIGAINQQQADIRLDLQFTQYNRQLFIAQRTLGDLAALTGREGGTFVGQLQRQDLLLSRRSQALSLQSQQLGLQTQELQLQSAELGQQQNVLQLELAQRRVNFQRAAAGFTAPGTTPEERAARIEEAKIEADYAQREIDFQRQQLGIQQKTLVINREQFGLQQASTALAQQQFQNQIALQDALNNRAFEDQAAAIAEMQKAFEASQQLQALENLKGLITTQRDLFVQELEAQVAAEEEFIKAQATFAADIMSQTGEFVEDTVTQVGSVFQRIASEFARSGLGRLVGAPQTSQPSGGGSGGGGIFPKAEGHHGRYSTPTSFTIGEAGTEEIAILRNPRQVLAGVGGGGGGNIFITITGNDIKADDDNALAAMADRLARMVEERLGRRATQLGFSTGR